MWRWVGGVTVCKLQGFIVETTYTASITTLMMISNERLKAIIDPLNARARNFLDRGYRKILILWGIFLAVCSPLLALYQLELDKRGEIACNNSAMENISRQVFYSLHALFFFAFPLSYMIFSQKKMFLALRTTRIVPFQLSGSVETSYMRHKKVAKTLFALTIAFVFCWSPFMVIRTLMYFHLVEPGAIWRISQLLICLNAVLDPIMYGIYGGNLKTNLRRGCCCRNSSGDSLQSRLQGGSANQVFSQKRKQLIKQCNNVQTQHIEARETFSC